MDTNNKIDFDYNSQQIALRDMINSYYKCELTIPQERELALILANLPEDELKEDTREILAELSLEVIMRKNAAKKSNGLIERLARYCVAVSLLTICILTGYKIYQSGANSVNSDCYAYVDGKLIENKSEVKAIMISQLHDCYKEQEKNYSSINEDLMEFRDLIDVVEFN